MMIITDYMMRPFWYKLRHNLDMIETLIDRQEQIIADLSDKINCQFVMHDEIVETIIAPSLVVVADTIKVSEEIEKFMHVLLCANCFESGCLNILNTIKALKESAEKSKVKTIELHQRLDESQRSCFDERIEFLGSEIKNNPIEIDICNWDGLSTEKDLLLALHQLLSEGNNFYIELRGVYNVPDGYMPPLNKDTII